MAMAPPVETTTVHASARRPCRHIASAVIPAALPMTKCAPSWVMAFIASCIGGLSILWTKIVNGELASAAVYVALLLASTLFVAWPQRDPSLWALDAYNAGWQALESNNLELAEKKLAIAHAYVPDNSETLFALGNLRLAQNNPKSAAIFYREVLMIDGRHKGAFNNLGVIAFDATDYDAAELWFRRAADVDPRSAKTHFLLAKALLAKNDRGSAQNEINAAIGLKAGQPEFLELKKEIDQESPR